MTDLVWITNEPGGVGTGVFRYAESGTPDSVPFFTNGAMSSPGDIGLVLNGSTYEVWIVNSQHTILRFGTDDTLLGTITDADFNFPLGIFQVPSTGKVWISADYNKVILYNADGTPTGTTLTPDPLLFTANMCLGPDGAVWAGNVGTAAYSIYRFNTDGTPFAGGTITISGLNFPYGLAPVGSNVWCVDGGDIYVIDTSGATVHTITDPSGGNLFTLELVGSEVWLPGFNVGPVYRFDAATYAALGTIVNSGFTGAYALRVVPAAYKVPHPYVFTPVRALAPGRPVLVSPQIEGGTGGYPGNIGLTIASTVPITYVWDPVLPGALYRLQASTDPTFATTFLDVPGLTATSYSDTAYADATVYYWRVQATLGGATGPWSYIGWFVVLDSYATISPVSGSTVHTTLVSGIYLWNVTWTLLGTDAETHALYLADSNTAADITNPFIPPLGLGSAITGPFSWTLSRGLNVLPPAGAGGGYAVNLAAAPGLSASVTLVYP